MIFISTSPASPHRILLLSWMENLLMVSCRWSWRVEKLNCKTWVRILRILKNQNGMTWNDGFIFCIHHHPRIQPTKLQNLFRGRAIEIPKNRFTIMIRRLNHQLSIIGRFVVFSFSFSRLSLAAMKKSSLLYRIREIYVDTNNLHGNEVKVINGLKDASALLLKSIWHRIRLENDARPQSVLSAITFLSELCHQLALVIAFAADNWLRYKCVNEKAKSIIELSVRFRSSCDKIFMFYVRILEAFFAEFKSRNLMVRILRLKIFDFAVFKYNSCSNTFLLQHWKSAWKLRELFLFVV